VNETVVKCQGSERGVQLRCNCCDPYWVQ